MICRVVFTFNFFKRAFYSDYTFRSIPVTLFLFKNTFSLNTFLWNNKCHKLVSVMHVQYNQ